MQCENKFCPIHQASNTPEVGGTLFKSPAILLFLLTGLIIPAQQTETIDEPTFVTLPVERKEGPAGDDFFLRDNLLVDLFNQELVIQICLYPMRDCSSLGR